MTPEQFQQVYPLLAQWMASTLDSFAPQARPVSASGFTRLQSYFGKDLLDRSKYVLVNRLPMPPLSKMGLDRFSAFENGNFAGITYLNTFFVQQSQAKESLFFHEMIHVVQWEVLGPERFLASYADGLERFGYAASPLEAMAYAAQSSFDTSNDVFDAQEFVLKRLQPL